MTDEPVVLPEVVHVTPAFASRAPSQRVIETITRMEGGSFGDLAQNQAFRLTAFRALMRDFPAYDAAAMWAHAYDVEVEIAEADPTNGSSPTTGPPSVSTSAAYPPRSTD